MISPTAFRDLVSGRHRGMGPAVLRGLLRLCEYPYSQAMRWRNRRYDRGRAKVHHLDVPIISVGNLTMGGTGKTPLVEWITRYVQSQDVRVAIVSRGYGASADGRNDEARELELAFPTVPHLQNSDRVAAAVTAFEHHRAEAIVLDDGFQHRRLARDLDIVLLDATEPFGFEHVFPRGTLREPVAGIARAQIVVLSRADMLQPEARRQIRKRVTHLSPGLLWCETVHRPQCLIDTTGQQRPIAALHGKRIAAFCGIGNPAGFGHSLATLGCEVAHWQEFADHHDYTDADVELLVDWAADVELTVCTRKDLVKLRRATLGKVPLSALQVELEFLAGQGELENAVNSVLPRT